MKIRHFVLTLILGIALIAAQLAAAGPVSQESETLAAQVNVTRDQINQLVAKMKNEQASGGFSHPDFIAKSRELNARIDAAMVEFEATMAGDILRPASLWIDRLKSIETSSAYGAEQKASLLKDQHTQATAAFKELSVKYKAALQKLYYVVLPKIEMKLMNYSSESDFCGSVAINIDITDWKFKSCVKKVTVHVRYFSSDPRAGFTSIDDTKVIDAWYYVRMHSPEVWAKSYDGSSFYGSGGDRPEIHEAIFKNVVEKDCMTTSCVALNSSQLASFITLVSETLDRNIEFKTAGGDLKLERLDFYFKSGLRYLETPKNYSRALRFDVQEAQYRTALVEQTAIAYAGSDPAKCQSEGDRLKALACFSQGGCLQEAEKSFIETAIQNGKGWGSAKSEKIACLRQS